MTGSHRLSVNIGITGLLAIYAVPLILVVLASFKSNTDIVNSPASLIFTPSAGAYFRVFDAMFLHALSNSVIISVGTTMLTVGVATTLSYILSREHSSWSVVVISALIVLQMLPAAVAIIPQYRVLATLGVLGSTFGVILALSATMLPFTILILRPFFLSVPFELEEAAQLDGSGRFRTFTHVIFPLARNGVSVVAVLVFIHSWGDFLYPLSFLNDESQFPLSVLLLRQQGFYGTQWNNLMALALLGAIPIIIIFAFVAKRLTAGLALGVGK